MHQGTGPPGSEEPTRTALSLVCKQCYEISQKLSGTSHLQESLPTCSVLTAHLLPWQLAQSCHRHRYCRIQVSCNLRGR